MDYLFHSDCEGWLPIHENIHFDHGDDRRSNPLQSVLHDLFLSRNQLYEFLFDEKKTVKKSSNLYSLIFYESIE